MSAIHNRFYKGRVALNVLSHDIANATEIFAAAEGHVLIGVLSKNYETVDEAVRAMGRIGEAIEDAVSIGLGGGDPGQATMVAEIVKHYAGQHINQVFTAVGITRGHLTGRTGWINSLVSPTGQMGYVNISTGPESSRVETPAIVPVRTAIALARDMGANALKYFPMNGLGRKAEYRAVAQACAEERFALEPTGGIDMSNFEEIVSIALQAGVPRVIPHVYSSIIDRETGKTNVRDVERLFAMVKRLVDADE